MGSCSGKSIEAQKKYAGYPTTSNRHRAGSVSTKQPEIVQPQRSENKLGLRLGRKQTLKQTFFFFFNETLDANKLQELHSHDMRVLVKLLNNENPEVSENTFQLICGISTNGIILKYIS